MGPKETMPAFEPPPFAPTADAKVSIQPDQLIREVALFADRTDVSLAPRAQRMRKTDAFNA